MLTVGLALLILGVRWHLVEQWGASIPQTDQWDAEGRAILAPWLRHDHNLGNLLVPHNEHRVALTRAVALGLTLANREWDQRLESVVNSWLPALLAAGLAAWLGMRLSRRATAALAVLLAVIYCVPFAWENIVHGFDSQQYFLVDFAVLSLAIFPFAPPFRLAWWLGAAGLALSLGSMATGFVAGGACAAIILVRLAQKDLRVGAAIPALIVCGVAITVGFLSRNIVPLHEPLKAHSFSEFWFAAVKALGWPAYEVPWGYASLLLWIPWVVISWQVCFGKRRSDPIGYFTFGLGLWTIVQIMSAAYARGAGGGDPASRYLDNVMAGILANGIALAVLLEQPARPLFKRLLPLWSFVCLTGFADQAFRVVPSQTPNLVSDVFYQQANVRNFLATGDEAYLQHQEIPYPNWIILERCLTDPNLRSTFPESIRLPLLLPVSHESGFFDADTRRRQIAGPAPRTAADGLSPTTPPLPNTSYHGSFGTVRSDGSRTWRSAPVSSAVGGWLKFLVAGDLGAPGVSLKLHDGATGRTVASVVPRNAPGDGWHAVYVRTPDAPFYVEAKVGSSDRWLAFSDPVEMGALSHWAWRLTRNAPWIAALGAITLIVAMFWSLSPIPISRQHDPGVSA